jgi:hypothetical protein
MLNYTPQPAIHALRSFADKPLHRRARVGAAQGICGAPGGEELTDEDDEGEA